MTAAAALVPLHAFGVRVAARRYGLALRPAAPPSLPLKKAISE
jgi:hypothetical protein